MSTSNGVTCTLTQPSLLLPYKDLEESNWVSIASRLLLYAPVVHFIKRPAGGARHHIIQVDPPEEGQHATTRNNKTKILGIIVV